MKPFELTWLTLESFLLPLHKEMRHRLLKIATSHAARPEVLDVGGRKSHCTIGVPASITITDLPRETEVQQNLKLGINEQIVEQTLTRRSNIRQILFDDMTHSTLASQAFDGVFAVEVLEHVEEDELFVQEVWRVLKPGGFFLMSTPNGDFLKNTNPDHKRHYHKEQLHALLASVFESVNVDYAIQGGTYRKLGLKPLTAKHPLRTGLSMMGNFVNSLQSAGRAIKNQSRGTHHLIATAKKQN